MARLTKKNLGGQFCFAGQSNKTALQVVENMQNFNW